MRLNKRLWKNNKVIELILSKKEYKIDGAGNRTFIDGKILKQMACKKCPIKIECAIGNTYKCTFDGVPTLLPNIISGPRIYCFNKIRR